MGRGTDEVGSEGMDVALPGSAGRTAIGAVNATG
jgi:hypothetical protein